MRFDEAVLAQPPEIVGGLAGGDGAGAVCWQAEVFSEQAAEVFAEEPAGVQPADRQDVQERLSARVGEPQAGDAGAVVVDDRVAGGLRGFGSDAGSAGAGSMRTGV